MSLRKRFTTDKNIAVENSKVSMIISGKQMNIRIKMCFGEDAGSDGTYQ